MQRLRQLTHYRTDGTLADVADLSDDPRVVRFDYTVRADGRRTAADEFWYTVGSATQSSPLQASYQFTYDNLGRLTDEVFEHWDNSLDYRDRFAYDPAGNRVEKSRDASRDGSVDARTAYRFDVNDRLIDELAYGRSSDPESRTTYTYDHTQNTGYRSERFVSGSQSTRLTLTHVYSYDLQGRLFTATVTNYNDAGTASSITRSTYDYGHTGIRVSAVNEIDSTADGTFETRTKIEYLVDHHNHTGYQQVIRESHYDVATGKLVKAVDYTFGHDEISQTVVTYNSAGTEVSRDKQWFLHDGKANVRGLLDAASAILTIAGIEQIYFYDAYGSLLNLQASQAATTLLYNGEMFDALTGNQYLRARYYNPASAQFNRLDPFFGNHQDPQSFNKYAFVHGDPLSGVDPTGMWTISVSIAGMAISVNVGAYAASVAVSYLVGKAISAGFHYYKDGNLNNFQAFEWMDLLSFIPGAVFLKFAKLPVSLLRHVPGKFMQGYLFASGRSPLMQQWFVQAFGQTKSWLSSTTGLATNLYLKSGNKGFLHMLRRHVPQYFEGVDDIAKLTATTFWPSGTTGTNVLAYLDEAITLLGKQVNIGGLSRVKLSNNVVVEMFVAADGRIATIYPVSGPGVTKAIESFKALVGDITPNLY